MKGLTLIRASYRDPARALAALAAPPQREGQVLVILMSACAVIFVSALPNLVNMPGEAELAARVSAGLFGWMFVAPLALYAIAGLLLLAFRVFGRRKRPFDLRLALFWALLVAAPFWLLNMGAGLVANPTLAKVLSAVSGLGILTLVVLYLRSVPQQEQDP